MSPASFDSFQVIFIYAAQFSMEAGVAIDEFLSAVIIGLIRCLTTLIIAFASDGFGRKPLAVFSGSGMFLSILGLALCSVYSLSNTNFFWVPTTLLYIFIFTGSFGFLTLPFAMVGEMYPQKSRGFAVGITMAVGFMFSFINIKTFGLLFATFGSFVMFLFYSFVALVGIGFAIFILPETKGKSLEEIESYFRKH